MQTLYRSLLIATLTLASTALWAAPAGGSGKGSAGFKCWTNNEGVRECGNAIPPEYAQGESSNVNKQGVITETQSRARTPEERAAEEQRLKAEAERAAEEKRQQDARVKADKVLRATFASEQDIVMARDRKITSVEGTIELTSVSIAKQQQVVEGYRTKIANLEKSGKPVPPELSGDLASEQQKLDNKLAFVAAKRAEVDALRAEYDGYVKRWRELMQRPNQQ